MGNYLRSDAGKFFCQRIINKWDKPVYRVRWFIAGWIAVFLCMPWAMVFDIMYSLLVNVTIIIIFTFVK